MMVCVCVERGGGGVRDEMEKEKARKKGRESGEGDERKLTVLRVAVAHAEDAAAALVGRVGALVLLVVAGAVCR